MADEYFYGTIEHSIIPSNIQIVINRFSLLVSRIYLIEIRRPNYSKLRSESIMAFRYIE